MHFAGNMWFLHIFGDNVEDRLGTGCTPRSISPRVSSQVNALVFGYAVTDSDDWSEWSDSGCDGCLPAALSGRTSHRSDSDDDCVPDDRRSRAGLSWFMVRDAVHSRCSGGSKRSIGRSRLVRAHRRLVAGVVAVIVMKLLHRLAPPVEEVPPEYAQMGFLRGGPSRDW